MAERPFVLVPLAEIAAETEAPGIGPVSELAERVGDEGVRRVKVRGWAGSPAR
jgi:7,8-dihydro-6-hydroxymethylpterin-pyrophosphokinase